MKIQEHTYKPLPSSLTIKKSPIHGLGLFAKDKDEDGYIGQLESPGYFPKGWFFGISHIHSSVFDRDSFDFEVSFEQNEVLPYFDPILKKEDIFPNNMIRTPLGGFINHSDDPNITLNYLNHGCWGIIASQDIYPGEEITVDYRYTPCGVIKQ